MHRSSPGQFSRGETQGKATAKRVPWNDGGPFEAPSKHPVGAPVSALHLTGRPWPQWSPLRVPNTVGLILLRAIFLFPT